MKEDKQKENETKKEESKKPVEKEVELVSINSHFSALLL